MSMGLPALAGHDGNDYWSQWQAIANDKLSVYDDDTVNSTYKGRRRTNRYQSGGGGKYQLGPRNGLQAAAAGTPDFVPLDINMLSQVGIVAPKTSRIRQLQQGRKKSTLRSDGFRRSDHPPKLQHFITRFMGWRRQLADPENTRPFVPLGTKNDEHNVLQGGTTKLERLINPRPQGVAYATIEHVYGDKVREALRKNEAVVTVWNPERRKVFVYRLFMISVPSITGDPLMHDSHLTLRNYNTFSGVNDLKDMIKKMSEMTGEPLSNAFVLPPESDAINVWYNAHLYRETIPKPSRQLQQRTPSDLYASPPPLAIIADDTRQDAIEHEDGDLLNLQSSPFVLPSHQLPYVYNNDNGNYGNLLTHVWQNMASIPISSPSFFSV